MNNMRGFLANHSIISGEKNITGVGLIEENVEVYGKIRGIFVIGCYTKIAPLAQVINSLIGRFTTICYGAIIGDVKFNKKNFSNHMFAYDERMLVADEYLNRLQSRYYYERHSYVIIGSDVYVGANAVVCEGVEIGDGAIVYPGSYVDQDVPAYAIVSGIPAKIIGYRFYGEQLKFIRNLSWWKYDLVSSLKSFSHGDKINKINYVNNVALFEFLKLNSNNLPKLEKHRFYINTYLDSYEEFLYDGMITGPSHVYRWFQRYNHGLIKKPNKFCLFPIPAVSLFSDNLDKLVTFWSNNFGRVILFVPDFRIGNTSVFSPCKNGRYIDASCVDDETSLQCYRLGISKLDKFYKYKNVYFLFWCLYGRELFNKRNHKYFNTQGKYHHPIWNYTDIVNNYSDVTIKIENYFNNESFLNSIVDASIHPTDECYDKLTFIFDNL